MSTGSKTPARTRLDAALIRRAATVLMVCAALTTSPVLAQDPGEPALPSPPSAGGDEAERVTGAIEPTAPAAAGLARELLVKETRRPVEVFANRNGLLSVHKGLSASGLRALARKLEEVKGIRRALTDTPRRMILVIFDTAPPGSGPEAIAGPLENIRRRYREDVASRPQLGGAGARPGGRRPDPTPPAPRDPQPGDPMRSPDPRPDKPPLDEPDERPGPGEPGTSEAPDAVKRAPKPKAGETAEPAADPLKTRPYSTCRPALDPRKIARRKVTGKINGRRALSLWLEGSDRELATVVARETLKRHPKDVEAGAVLAMYHLHRGDKLKAYRNMRTVLHYRPGKPVFHRMYAEVLASLEMTARAREELRVAAELEGDRGR